jgi:ATP-dependent DNA helicase RecG
MVEIFDDRVEIVSPGGVPKGITPENFGTVSITRNSVIAGLLYRIDYIEEMGTGIRRMKNAAQEANVAEPKFELSGFFKVTFKRNELDSSIGYKSLSNVENTADDQINVQINDQINVQLNEIEDKVLSVVSANPRLTLDGIAEQISKSPKTAQRCLDQLRKKNIIRRIGARKDGYWEIVE